MEELGIPYEVKRVGLAEVSQEPYISLNPNGRVPTIEDPNTGLTIWEVRSMQPRLRFQRPILLTSPKTKSGAVVEYLIETYDTKSALSYPKSNLKEAAQCRTWSYFQCSGQGPYFGQMGWFAHHHPEKIPSVLERYTKEILRVNGVIDLHLGKQGTGYLVGDKCTYADLNVRPLREGAGHHPRARDRHHRP